MRIEVGKELEFVRHRLRDIAYLAEQTAPIDKNDWETYAKSIGNLIAQQAQQALTALTLADGQYVEEKK